LSLSPPMTSAEAGPAEILNNTAIIAATVNNIVMRLISATSYYLLAFGNPHKWVAPTLYTIPHAPL
jgi:hypothetical protein